MCFQRIDLFIEDSFTSSRRSTDVQRRSSERFVYQCFYMVNYGAVPEGGDGSLAPKPQGIDIVNKTPSPSRSPKCTKIIDISRVCEFYIIRMDAFARARGACICMERETR